MAFVTLFDIARHDMGQAQDERELAVFGMAGRKGAPMPPPPPGVPGADVVVQGPQAPIVGVPVPGAPGPIPGMPPGPDAGAAPFSGGSAGPGGGGMEPFTPPPAPGSDGGVDKEPTILGLPRMQVILVGGGLGLLLAAVVAKKLMRKPAPQQYWSPPPGWAPPQQAAPAPAQAPATRNSRRSVQYEVTLGGPGHVEEVTMLPGGLAELRRHLRPVCMFRPTDHQRRKIESGKGSIRITSGQIRGR